MNSTTFPLFRKAKSDPELVVKFFDENRGEVIESPIKSRDSLWSVGETISAWKSCFNTEVWEPYYPKLIKRKIL